jgi:hypothetical protein
MSKLSAFETREPNEADNIAEMIDILRRKMERDYEKGDTKRDAHPKTVGLLRAHFITEADLPAELRVGIFKKVQSFECYVRTSNASGKIQSDAVSDPRGLAIKLMTSPSKNANAEVPLGQDFVLMSSPVMPLGTIALFRDAVYYTIESSPLWLAAKFFMTGNAMIFLGLLKLRISPNSPFDIRYWSTTPYLLGKNRAVKYSLLPTSKYTSRPPKQLSDSYLSDAMQKHLDKHTASFDFCVQLQKEGMPIEDASVLWDEKESPFIKVATLKIPKQKFRTQERENLAETLSFSPGNTLPAHAALGGLNRARISIYLALSKFRHERDGRINIE